MNVKSNQIIGGKYGVSESSQRQLMKFLQLLKDKGLDPISCTVDGNPNAIKTITTLWPDIVIQRCLVYIQRQSLVWCRRSPKTTGARRLRDIFLRVVNIRTPEERDKYLELIIQWEQRYGQDIGLYPAKGRVFSDIKRARSMLINALPDMFRYLDDSSISFTTNGLESCFSRLKGHYRLHRGLCKKKLENYFGWYMFFKPK